MNLSQPPEHTKHSVRQTSVELKDSDGWSGGEGRSPAQRHYRNTAAAAVWPYALGFKASTAQTKLMTFIFKPQLTLLTFDIARVFPKINNGNRASENSNIFWISESLDCGGVYSKSWVRLESCGLCC